MQKALKDFGGWPIIEGDEWNEEKINLTSILIKLQVLGLVSIFELDIQAIRKNFMIMVSTIIYLLIVYQNSQGILTRQAENLRKKRKNTNIISYRQSINT